VVDGHVDVILRVVDQGFNLLSDRPEIQADIPKWRRGGVNVVFMAAWVDPRNFPGEMATARAHQLIDGIRAQATLHPQHIAFCQTAAEVRRAVARERIAFLIGVEGGVAINNDLSQLTAFRKKGVRYMTLTWRGNLDWAGSSQSDNPRRGLTEFGREVIREMNRLGIIVDLSHTSDQTVKDALAVTSKPVIFSHSNARVLANHPRNVTDDILRAVAKNGGLVAVNVAGHFLRPTERGWALRPGQPDVNTVVDQIDYIAKVAGVDHVGFGSDYEGYIRPARGLATTQDVPKIWDELLRRGYSQAEVDKIAGGNFLRVLEANE
jgi:membrane dipeptidase